MIAARRDDVDDLNDRARQRLTAAGALTGPELTVAGHVFQAGDEVLFTRNDHGVGVVNGQRGIVQAVGDNTVYVDTGTGVVAVAQNYLDAGHLRHGYATTVHKAQGVTVDRTFVLVSDAVYREWAYVALSRGRRHNALYALDEDPDQPHLPGAPRQRQQRLATDIGIPTALEPTPRLRQLERLIARRSDAAREVEAAATKAERARARVRDAEAVLGRLTRWQTLTTLRLEAALAETSRGQWQDHLARLDDDIGRLSRQQQMTDEMNTAARDGATSPLREHVEARARDRLAREHDDRDRPRADAAWDLSL